MVLKMIEGFERQSGVVGGVTVYAASFTVTYPAGRSGGNCINGAFNFDAFGIQMNLPTTLAQLVVGGAFKCSSSVLSLAAILTLRESTTTHLRIRADASNHIQLINSAGTTLATGATVFDFTGWNYIEMEAKIDDTTGYCKVWVNGSLEINVSGIDTKNGGTGLIDNALWGTGATVSAVGSAAVDDFYYCDTTGSVQNTALGDCVIQQLYPTATGASNQWVNSAAAAASTNWSYVDDLSATDYVGSPTSGNKDTYAMADLAASTSIVLAYEIDALALKSDAGVPAGATQVIGRDSVGNEEVETVALAAALTTTATWVRGSLKTKMPDGATALSVAGVNAMQVGVKVS